jgi:exonuclease VII small subunit
VGFKQGFMAILVAMFVAFTAAGCGNGDDSASDPIPGGAETSDQRGGTDSEAPEAEPPEGEGDGDAAAGRDGSRFARRAVAICETGKQRLLAAAGRLAQELGDRFGTEAGETEVARKVAVPEMERQVDALGNLEPPRSDEQDVEVFLESWQRALDTTKEGSQPLNEAMAGVDDLARQAGLGPCAYG